MSSSSFSTRHLPHPTKRLNCRKGSKRGPLFAKREKKSHGRARRNCQRHEKTNAIIFLSLSFLRAFLSLLLKEKEIDTFVLPSLFFFIIRLLIFCFLFQRQCDMKPESKIVGAGFGIPVLPRASVEESAHWQTVPKRPSLGSRLAENVLGTAPQWPPFNEEKSCCCFFSPWTSP